MADSTGNRVDWQTLEENFDNDKFALGLIVDAFLESVDESLNKVRLAVQGGEKKPMAMAAHSLKGAILNFGAKEAVSSAQRLENLGYGEGYEDAQLVFAELEFEVRALVAELHAESVRYRES